MKFQIPNIHHSKINRRTHAHTDRQTDRQAESNMHFPSNFFKVGGIKIKGKLYQVLIPKSTISQSCREGTTDSWVSSSTLGSKCVLLKDTVMFCGFLLWAGFAQINKHNFNNKKFIQRGERKWCNPRGIILAKVTVNQLRPDRVHQSIWYDESPKLR